MTRLVTFGCSYTYGQGLPDCRGNVDPPSQLSWPALLSSTLRTELVNHSYPASSNFEITYNILNFDFKQDDVVVIMWTHFARDSFFRQFLPNICPIDRLGPWSYKKDFLANIFDTGVHAGNRWIENMNEKTFTIKTWAHIHHAGLYLKSKNLRYIHYPIKPSEYVKYKPSWEIENYYDKGFDWIDNTADRHPGVKSHKKMADTLFQILYSKYGTI